MENLNNSTRIETLHDLCENNKAVSNFSHLNSYDNSIYNRKVSTYKFRRHNTVRSYINFIKHRDRCYINKRIKMSDYEHDSRYRMPMSMHYGKYSFTNMIDDLIYGYYGQ